MLINKISKDRLIDVNAIRGAAGDMSDHHLVAAKLKTKTRFQGGRRESEG